MNYANYLSLGFYLLVAHALCGLEGEHKMPKSWEMVPWKAPRGYSNKKRQEVAWFSPHCLRTRNLFGDSMLRDHGRA